MPAENGTSIIAWPYFGRIRTRTGDRNDQFFDDDYTYGNDTSDPNSIYRDIHVLDAAKQDSETNGFPYYNNMLRNRGYGNIIAAPIAKKVFDLGQLFDGATDSQYKQKAIDDGIYVDGITNTAAAQAINTLVGSAVASAVQFVNWRTGQMVYLVDIDVGALGTAGHPHNGIIYSKWPLRLSNAANLPGINDGNRKAVFTVLCEESIYLKGNYNTGGTDPDNWKISNIATKKIIYALSNTFNDPQTRPDFMIYHNYKGAFANITAWDVAPAVYVQKNATGGYYFATAPYYREGDPTIDNGDGTFGNGEWCENYDDWVNNLITICGNNDVFYSNQGPYNFVKDASAAKQADWRATNPVGPHNVDRSYFYNSLFITPYTYPHGIFSYFQAVSGGPVLNTQLENWTSRTLYSNTSMIYLYDPSDPLSNDEYKTNLTSQEDPFDYRTAPFSQDCWACNKWSIARWYDEPPERVINYEARFPQVTPKNYEAVLGLTGESIWRQVSEAYFIQETQ